MSNPVCCKVRVKHCMRCTGSMNVKDDTDTEPHHIMRLVITIPLVNIPPKISPGTTEYYCHDCKADLCIHCKETHVIDLNTKNHNVTIYREKFTHQRRREKCISHPGQIYEMHCTSCDLPICFHCRKHRCHLKKDIRAVYENKRKRNNFFLINLRSEALYNACILLPLMKNDLSIFPRESTMHLSNAQFQKSQELKNLMDSLIHVAVLKYKRHFTKNLRNQIKNTVNSNARIQNYEHNHEQSANRPVQFLRFMKRTRFPEKLTCLKRHFSVTNKIEMKDFIAFLSEIVITEGGKRLAKSESFFTLMSSPVLQKSIGTHRVEYRDHISYVTPDRIWISGISELYLVDAITGYTLYSLEDPLPESKSGLHAVNSLGELFFIDKEYNIQKLSRNRETLTTFSRRINAEWEPQCVYCSPCTGDILVGAKKNVTGKVIRYNDFGDVAQILQSDKFNTLFRHPWYITENNNLDVVVSDSYVGRGAVVVMSREGKHRFSYFGPPSGSGLAPRGICTDALSHILVCDDYTKTVQMIDRDGVFLKYLLTVHSKELPSTPLSLSYDSNKHLLWVATFDTISVFRHINTRLPDCVFNG